MANLTFFAAGRRRKLFRDKLGGPLKFRFQHKRKQIKRSTGTVVEAAAKVIAAQKIEEIAHSRILSEASFDGIVERFLATRKAKAKHTRDNDKYFAAALRQTFHLSMTTSAREIRTGDILTWLNAQATARRWRNRTFNHFRLWLWQVFNLAVMDRLVTAEENPFHGKAIRRKRPEPVVRNIPTLQQFSVILDDVRERSAHVADFLEFLGCAGVGQAEAASLHWSDIGGEKIRFVRRKTGIPFEVPIYVWLAPLVVRLMEARNGSDGSELVFTGISAADKALARACDRLGFKHFTQRNLRAMLIKRLYDQGVPVKRIALWQGHRDGGKLIQEVYTEVFCETDAAAEKADLALVGGACNPRVSQFKIVA